MAQWLSPTGSGPHDEDVARAGVVCGVALHQGWSLRWSPQPAAVGAGHQRGEVVGGQERRRRWRDPSCRGPWRPPTPRGSRAGRRGCSRCRSSTPRSCRPGRLQVPEEVRADVVATQAPDVPRRGRLLEHGGGAAADLVDVVDLPRRVVQVADRRRLHEHVVVLGGAPHEGGQERHLVADLEPQALDEERRAGLLVGGTDHHVPELAGMHPGLTQDPRRPLVHPAITPGAIGLRPRHRLLGDAGGDLHLHPHLAARVLRRHRVPLALDHQVQRGQRRGDAVQVVGVVGSDAELHEPPTRVVHHPQLLTAVGGGEPVLRRRHQHLSAVRRRDQIGLGQQPEIGVVLGGLPHVGHAEGDRGEPVQSHVILLGHVVERVGSPDGLGGAATPNSTSGPVEQDVCLNRAGGPRADGPREEADDRGPRDLTPTRFLSRPRLPRHRAG